MNEKESKKEEEYANKVIDAMMEAVRELGEPTYDEAMELGYKLMFTGLLIIEYLRKGKWPEIFREAKGVEKHE